MTTNQLFFSLTGVFVAFFGLFAGFAKYYVDAQLGTFDAKLGRLEGIFDAKLDKLEETLNAKLETLSARIESLENKVDRLFDFVVSHENRIAKLEERTKAL